MKTLTAAEANRHFPAVLKGVIGGESYRVTLCGKPVAVIAPVAADSRARHIAREILLTRLAAQPAGGEPARTRVDLYD